MAVLLGALQDEVVHSDGSALTPVDVLLLGCRGDPLHPEVAARRTAAAFPNCRLHVCDQPGPLWTARAELRALISGFLNA